MIKRYNFHGNLTDVMAKTKTMLYREVQQVMGPGLRMHPDARTRQQTVSLPDGVAHEISVPAKNADERNSVIQCYHQLGEASPREHALQVITEQVCASGSFLAEISVESPRKLFISII